MLDGIGTKQSHPFLIKNGKSQGSPNTLGYFNGTNIKTVLHTAIESSAFVFSQCNGGGGEEFLLRCQNFEDDTSAVGASQSSTTLRPYEQLFKPGFYKYEMSHDSATLWPT